MVEIFNFKTRELFFDDLTYLYNFILHPVPFISTGQTFWFSITVGGVWRSWYEKFRKPWWSLSGRSSSAPGFYW
jgi:hypothetical protein